MANNRMAKKPAKPQSPSSDAPRRFPLPLAGLIVVLAIGAAFFSYERSSPPSSGPAAAPAATAGAPGTTPAAMPASNEPPASARFGPHKQDTLPPLPETGFAPPRPMETVRAVYEFAAEHPEVLSYIPCYCGCDRQGHKGNDDCFVAERNAKGDVTAWDGHGMT